MSLHAIVLSMRLYSISFSSSSVAFQNAIRPLSMNILSLVDNRSTDLSFSDLSSETGCLCFSRRLSMMIHDLKLAGHEARDVHSRIHDT